MPRSFPAAGAEAVANAVGSAGLEGHVEDDPVVLELHADVAAGRISVEEMGERIRAHVASRRVAAGVTAD